VARQRLVFNDLETCRLDPVPNQLQIGDLEGDVRFGGGPKGRVDSEVQVEGTGAEPDPSPPLQIFRLRNLLQAQEFTVVPPGLRFVTPGYSQLHMMDGRNLHRQRTRLPG